MNYEGIEMQHDTESEDIDTRESVLPKKIFDKLHEAEAYVQTGESESLKEAEDLVRDIDQYMQENKIDQNLDLDEVTRKRYGDICQDLWGNGEHELDTNEELDEEAM